MTINCVVVGKQEMQLSKWNIVGNKKNARIILKAHKHIPDYFANWFWKKNGQVVLSHRIIVSISSK